MIAASAAASPRNSAARLPGEAGVWVVVVGDLLLFGLFFLTFTYYRAHSPEVFRNAAGTLSVPLGLINTVLLLTGSWFVARAVHEYRDGDARKALRLVYAGTACGLGFVAVKAIEWGQKFAAGLSVMSNDYFMFYFMLTGIHLLHVLVGIGVLCFLITVARRPSPRPAGVCAMESGGVFWHLVDVLWIVLFALFYLIR